MKKIFLFIIAALCVAACTKKEEGTQTITFEVGGDFTVNTESFDSKTSITDYSGMTFLRVLDYKNGILMQQIIKNTQDADFGRPELTLTPGTHDLYFVASAGTGLTFNFDNHCMVFYHKAGDTFWKHVEINVASNTPRQVPVILDRVVTRLKCTFTDTLTTNVATIDVRPGVWYLGLDYLTGKASTVLGVRVDSALTITPVPAQYNHSNTDFYLYSFSPDNSTQWSTDLYISAKTSNGTTIGSAALSNVPFHTNRTTHLSGNLFSLSDSATVFVNDTWGDDYTGTW